MPRVWVPTGCIHMVPCLQVEREIALHSRLRHRNIVAFHGHFADRDHVYMVLEYCSRQVRGQSEREACPLPPVSAELICPPTLVCLSLPILT